MNTERKTYAFKALLVIVVLIAGWMGVTLPKQEMPDPIGQPTVEVGSRSLGIANFTSDVVMDQDLTVAGAISVAGSTALGGSVVMEGATADAYETTLTTTDPTADRTITLPNVSGTVMLTANAGKMVLGVNTITDTLTLSHGLTTPQAAFCTLIQDAEANNATCSATISGGTVVIKTWKADGATAGSVGKLVSWMVTGQP